MNDMKLIMESWRKKTLNEVSLKKKGSGPTIGEFMTAMAKAKPNKMTSWLGGAAKLTAVLGGGILVGMATSGVGGVAAGAAIGKAADMIIDRLADKGQDMAQSLIGMLSTPDGERDNLSVYFDLDDRYEALLQDMGTGLGKKLVDELYTSYAESLNKLTRQLESNPELAEQPLSNYITHTANEFFRDFMANNDLSGVGVQISAPTD